MREDNGSWGKYYMTLVGKELYFFKDPLDV